MTNTKTELLSLMPQELEALMLELGEAKYRATQIFPQLHRGISPDEMTNLGKGLRQKLSEVACWHLPQIRRKLVSAIDGTVKYLFSLSDGNCVESVVMKYEHGNTICISSQVGCRMGEFRSDQRCCSGRDAGTLLRAFPRSQPAGWNHLQLLLYGNDRDPRQVYLCRSSCAVRRRTRYDVLAC